MEDVFKAIVASGQCGALSLFLALCIIYQTYMRGRAEAQREVDRLHLEAVRKAEREQIVSDAEARTRTAIAAVEAQKELAAAQIENARLIERLAERRRTARDRGYTTC